MLLQNIHILKRLLCIVDQVHLKEQRHQHTHDPDVSVDIEAQGYPQRFITKGAPIQIYEESGDIHRCGQILLRLARLQ
jgi:hypothetical protein